MARYFHSDVDIKSPWHQVLAAFWQRYPNPYSSHVLTEDVLYREVTPSNHLLSRRLLTKTNRLPGWAECIFPAHVARAVYVLEDSIVDPNTHTLTTKTWNLNHNTLMTVVERCLFEEDHSRPSWTKLRREACISSAVYGLARPIQEFGLSRFKSNQAKAMKGLEYALSKIQTEAPLISMPSGESHQRSISPSHHRPRPLLPRSPGTLSEHPPTDSAVTMEILRLLIRIVITKEHEVTLGCDLSLYDVVIREQVLLLNLTEAERKIMNISCSVGLL